MSSPNSLMEFSPFTPDIASSTLSSMFCEKPNVTPGNRPSLDPICWMSFGLVRPPGQSPSGLSCTKNSVLLNVVTSVPSSGRPSWEMTWFTTGKPRRVWRICSASADAASKEMSTGSVARTQRFPSSSLGMNSPPSAGSTATVAANVVRLTPKTRPRRLRSAGSNRA